MNRSEQIPDARRFSPATQRNREPLLQVLKNLLPDGGQVLEIASGTGEHGVWFCQQSAGLSWQCSDPNPDLRQSIAAHAEHADIALPPALDIDVTHPDWKSAAAERAVFDAVFCANMIHIAPWEATLGLLAGALRHLKPHGRLVVYGPFKRNGDHTAPSNAAFDQSLRSQNPKWGIRDLERVTEEAVRQGFGSPDIIEMPSNNLTLIFQLAR